MKRLYKTSKILRVLGWVLIGIAAALTLYNLASDTDGWNGLKKIYTSLGKEISAVERVPFDHQYFDAMRSAASTMDETEEERIADVRPYFSRWEKQIDKIWKQREAEAVENLYQEKAASLSAEEYIAYFEQLDSSEEQRDIKQAIEYIDSVVKPAAAKKAIAKAQAASAQGKLESFYATFSEEHGEEAGDYLQFLETLVAMLKEDIGGGASVKDITQYLSAMDYARYQTVLAAVIEQERQSNEDIRDELVAYLQGYKETESSRIEYTKFVSGDPAALKLFAQSVKERLTVQYADEYNINDFLFHDTLWKLVSDDEYDGSLTSFMKELRAQQLEYDKRNLDVQMTQYSRIAIEDSDKSSYVGIIAPILWFLAARVVLWWILGILLLVAAVLISKLVESTMMKRLDHAGIEEEDDVLLRVEHLKQYFRSGNYINKAVDDVSFYIKKGEVFGLVGESGCGKTTTGRTIINLYDPTEGDVYFQGLRISSTLNGLPTLKRSVKNEFEALVRAKKAETDIAKQKDPAQADRLEAEYKRWLKDEKAQLKKRISDMEDRALESYIEKRKCVSKYRDKRKAEITAAYEQEAKTLSGEAGAARLVRYKEDLKVASKDNIMTKMQMIFQDPIASINPRMTVREIIAEGLKIRGVTDEKYIDEKVFEVLEMVGLVREHASRYPHEFSGGQRQRIGIARAIVLEPDLIIADEPISALDVSIQAQVINLLNELRHKMGLTIMFIAHNLSVVKYFSDRIGVMYYGHLVELTTSEELFAHPLHPYTKSLLSAIPYPDPYHEKYRKRITYDPMKAHDYSVDKPTLREIKPGHFILCNDSELEAYKKELGI